MNETIPTRLTQVSAMEIPDPELSTAQVSKILGLSGRRVIQLAREGKLHPRWTVLGRFYDAEEVEKLAAERGRKTSNRPLYSGGQE